MKTAVAVVLALAGTAAAALGWVYSGAFDVGADAAHGALTTWLARTVRERSIAVRADDIVVPRLDDDALIARGADEYAEMCAGCHLAPGVGNNEFRQGLNPAAPELAQLARASDEAANAARQFWIVKHGIRMTAMPAWGLTHDDTTLWSIVAFLRVLPTLSAAQYAELTAGSESAHAEAHDESGHESHHDSGATDDHGAGAHADHHHGGGADDAAIERADDAAHAEHSDAQHPAVDAHGDEP